MYVQSLSLKVVCPFQIKACLNKSLEFDIMSTHPCVLKTNNTRVLMSKMNHYNKNLMSFVKKNAEVDRNVCKFSDMLNY